MSDSDHDSIYNLAEQFGVGGLTARLIADYFTRFMFDKFIERHGQFRIDQDSIHGEMLHLEIRIPPTYIGTQLDSEHFCTSSSIYIRHKLYLEQRSVPYATIYVSYRNTRTNYLKHIGFNRWMHTYQDMLDVAKLHIHDDNWEIMDKVI